MALKYSITHNGNIWNSTTDLTSIPISNGNVTSSITSAGTRTLNCAGKVAANDIIIGAKTLNCAGKIIKDNITIDAFLSKHTKIVATGYNGIAWVSEDSCNTWSGGANFPSGAGSCYCSAFGDGRFVASGSGTSATLYNSVDGLTWNSIDGLLSPTTGAKNVAYGNGVFIYVKNKYIYYSTNGITWTLAPVEFPYAMYTVCYGNGRFVAIGYSGYSYQSTDGIGWTQLSNSPSSNISRLSYCNGKFITFLGSTTQNIVYYLNDGSSDWSYLNTGLPYSTSEWTYIYDIAYDGTYWWITGGHTIKSESYITTYLKVYRGASLSSWVSMYNDSTVKTGHCIHCVDGLCIVGSDYSIYYSKNGYTWSSKSITGSILSIISIEVD